MSTHDTDVSPAAASRAGVLDWARAGARQALQWRLLLLWLLALALPLLLASLPMGLALDAALGRSLLGAGLAERLDPPLLIELMSGPGLRGVAPVAGLPALVVLLLLLPWLSGLVIAAARRPGERLRFGALLQGGLAEYGRMARLWVWALLLLGLAGAAGAGLMHLASQAALKQVLEADADLLRHAALAGSALLVLLVHATLDAARAQFVVEPRRRSAVRAWWAAARGLLRRPRRLAVYLLVTLVGLATATLLGRVRLEVPAVGPAGLVLALVLGQALVLALSWMRCARLMALVAAAR